MNQAVPGMQADVAANLGAVRAQIVAAALAAGRDPAAVKLVAVSKLHDAGVVRRALAAGQRVFGENRVQEAAEKWPALRAAFADLELHLIGPLQTNKVRQALALFDVIETVDRPKLARAIADGIAATGRNPDLYVQINTGEEAQKAGIAPSAADAFIAQCRSEFGLKISGLMCIPPHDAPPGPHFALLAEIAGRNGIAGLSMGMSSDYKIAIGLGATSVRVGTAIFGGR